MQNNDPCWLAYLWESWGPSLERQRELQELEDSIHAEGSLEKINKFKRDRARGKKAFDKKQELGQVYCKGGEKDARDWLHRAKANWLHDRDIETSLNKELEQRIERDQNLQKRHNQQSRKSNVRVTLTDGQHPNCLRTLKPANCWTIYVDETGNKFDTTENMNTTSKHVGRIVALAIPDDVRLDNCAGFHAADRTFDEVDTILQRILDVPVGILGFSIRDETARNRYWIGHILHLVRWTLLQLPVPTDEQGKHVRILIEQRETYDSKTNMKSLTEALEGELAAIDPDRFQDLHLKMGFMDKNHPMNGYVDVLAFTWGSTDRSNKDRLRKSKLNGHCFINANERSLHHLFLALTQGGPLAPTDWYDLCAEVSTEQADSFLRRGIDRLGADMNRFPKHWELYLAEVQMRLASKQYSIIELGSAIAWLQKYADKSQTIPGTLQLQLASSNLALSNHRGQINDDLVLDDCLEWVKKLEDEDPQLVVKTILRMASTTINNFEFNALQEVVDDWLAKPVAMAGLLNYGKLQSTRGQMYAFSGHPDLAIPWFDDAMASFARLSDPRQIKRETHHTGIYKIIALMDSIHLEPDHGRQYAGMETVFHALEQLFDNREVEAISRLLAASGQSGHFEHHLWLRAITRFPMQFVKAREAYLDSRGNWMTGNDYPWPLILAYRAWLLKDADENMEAGSLMKNAIDICLDAEHGETLKLIALVLDTLAQAINVPLANSDEIDKVKLRKRLPHAPWQALTEFSTEARLGQMTRIRIFGHLEKCLPFYFH